MQALQSLQHLFEASGNSLGLWFADPLEEGEAGRWLAGIRRRLRQAIGSNTRVFHLQVAEMIVAASAGEQAGHYFPGLRLACGNEFEQALVELVYGQLLVARRREPAMAHLERGFMLAARLLPPEDYFVVMKRHELLRLLPLTPAGGGPEKLDVLLDEARVIERLRRGHRDAGTVQRAHRDTLG